MSKEINTELFHNGMESPYKVPGLRQPPLGHEEPPVVEPHVPGPDGRTDFQALVEIVGQFPKKEESED